jgi:hypothetical protein
LPGSDFGSLKTVNKSPKATGKVFQVALGTDQSNWRVVGIIFLTGQIIGILLYGIKFG